VVGFDFAALHLESPFNTNFFKKKLKSSSIPVGKILIRIIAASILIQNVEIFLRELSFKVMLFFFEQQSVIIFVGFKAESNFFLFVSRQQSQSLDSNLEANNGSSLRY